MNEPFPDDPGAAKQGQSPKYVRPPDWKRKDGWETNAIPMPRWATAFARTGKLPLEPERQSNESGDTLKEREARDSMARYGAVWRGCVREMSRVKAEAARAIIVHGYDSPIGKAARQRGFDVDEEWARLRKLRDARAPLHIRGWPPIEQVGTAGQSVAQAERQASKSPLFDAQRRAAGEGHDYLTEPFEVPL